MYLLILTAAIVVFIIGYIYWNPLKMHKWIFSTTSTIYKLNSACNKSHISITIDDVPYKNRTILKNMLDTFKHKLTFFVISSFVNNSNYDLVRAVREGHMLGNHGVTDRCHYSLSKDELKKEIFECQTVLKNIYAAAEVILDDTIYYRPGCGYINKYMECLEQKGIIRLVLGSIYSNDPHIPLLIDVQKFINVYKNLNSFAIYSYTQKVYF